MSLLTCLHTILRDCLNIVMDKDRVWMRVCEMLKRNLFIQGLLLQWQGKVLPSAETFADALYQAWRMEEQAKQLVKMHPFGVGQRNNLTTPSKKSQELNSSSQY
uniref:Uncharacterized protein n=1 Tax=Amphimedon queenslandica TaxID=400682 RepID=A0A1X7U0M3_AMPQE